MYNRSSLVQAAGLAPAVTWLAEAARHVPLGAPGSPLVVADYGSSQGRNSLGPIGTAVRVLRERAGADRPISVVHTDLPSNDFGALFETVLADPESYLRHDPNIFPYAVGRSFYERLFPPSSVTIGWSSWAMHWLSRVPASVPDHIHHSQSADLAVRAAYVQQGAEDWRTFLTHRGCELCPEGRLVVMFLGLSEDGCDGWEWLRDSIWDSLRALIAQGIVTPEESTRMVTPTVGRGVKEMLAPFGESRFAGLEVVEVDTFPCPDPIGESFAVRRDTEAVVSDWAAFTRAWAAPTLATALDGPMREERAASFGDRLEAELRERIAARPLGVPGMLGRIHLVRIG
jgi:hypothetical protein